MKQQPSFLKKTICIAAALFMFAAQAFATPTALATTVLTQNNVSVTAGALNLTFTACDATNGNSFVSTGREVLLVQNSGGSTYTFTVNSVADNFGRTDTSLTAYSLAASAIAAIQMKYQAGWMSGTTISMTCSNAAIKYAVLQYN
jgi:hypothetical protein